MDKDSFFEKLQREGLSLASISKRGYAFMIDELLISLLVLFMLYDKIKAATSTQEVIFVLNSVMGYILIVKILYHTFFVWQYRATLGKMLFKIEVIDEHSFLNLSFFNSFLRALVRLFSESLFYLGFLWAFFDPKRQTWHDKVARSLVVDV